MSTEQSDQSHKIFPQNTAAAFRNLNDQNRKFWAKQSQLTEQLITDPVVYPLALHHMRLDADRLSLRERKSIDCALVEADQKLKEYMLLKNPSPAEKERKRHLSRKGGSASKTDELQMMIQTCVRQSPGISQRELLHHLKTYPGRGILRVIDNETISKLRRTLTGNNPGPPNRKTPYPRGCAYGNQREPNLIRA